MVCASLFVQTCAGGGGGVANMGLSTSNPKSLRKSLSWDSPISLLSSSAGPNCFLVLVVNKYDSS